jgi:hypothetical protein
MAEPLDPKEVASIYELAIFNRYEIEASMEIEVFSSNFVPVKSENS